MIPNWAFTHPLSDTVLSEAFHQQPQLAYPPPPPNTLLFGAATVAAPSESEDHYSVGLMTYAAQQRLTG